MVEKEGRERGRETYNFDVVLSLTLVAMHGILLGSLSEQEQHAMQPVCTNTTQSRLAGNSPLPCGQTA